MLPLCLGRFGSSGTGWFGVELRRPGWVPKADLGPGVSSETSSLLVDRGGAFTALVATPCPGRMTSRPEPLRAEGAAIRGSVLTSLGLVVRGS